MNSMGYQATTGLGLATRVINWLASDPTRHPSTHHPWWSACLVLGCWRHGLHQKGRDASLLEATPGCDGWIIRMNAGEDVGQEGGERAQNDRRLVGKR